MTDLQKTIVENTSIAVISSMGEESYGVTLRGNGAEIMCSMVMVIGAVAEAREIDPMELWIEVGGFLAKHEDDLKSTIKEGRKEGDRALGALSIEQLLEKFKWGEVNE